jgi:CheY-like chemotaxis protein
LPATVDGKPCKVLLAEDEENFRVFMDWALRERGYEVISAKDGQEAFERFQEAPESFGLAILDSYMPRMGGLEAYLRMQVLRPDLPVLFASGFTRGTSVDVLVAGCPGPASVLLKPFSATDLLEAVQKALAPR